MYDGLMSLDQELARTRVISNPEQRAVRIQTQIMPLIDMLKQRAIEMREDAILEMSEQLELPYAAIARRIPVTPVQAERNERLQHISKPLVQQAIEKALARQGRPHARDKRLKVS